MTDRIFITLVATLFVLMLLLAYLLGVVFSWPFRGC